MAIARSCFLSSLLLTALSACSSEANVSTDDPVLAQRVYGEEDKRVAKALSIGGDDTPKDESPQYRAMLCNLALSSIKDRMFGSGVLSEQQQRAFSQAHALYLRKAEEGLSKAELHQNRISVQTTYPEGVDRARIAIGCLRDLG